MGKDNNNTGNSISFWLRKHPIICNLLIIVTVAVLGLYVVYLALAIFTKHGERDVVPGVENMTYTQALEVLHDKGFRVDIRDSVYRDDVKPGYVIEQFPKANSSVKPGRKIFLYINAVHPKEVILDNDNHPNEFAMKGESYRSALAKLEEYGFKNVRTVKVLGTSDRVVKVMANGKPVRKMQKVPVNAVIVVEISDGQLGHLKDSLEIAEYERMYRENPDIYATSVDEYTEEENKNNDMTPEEPQVSNEDPESTVNYLE